MTKSYYIASGLENADKVRELKKVLDDAGWRHTYDWTVHGSVQKYGEHVITGVASNESVGVFSADVLIVLLPGGRGTHTELGMAIGKLDVLCFLDGEATTQNVRDKVWRVCVFSPDPEKDFGTNGTTCAFYFHPYVERFTSMTEMIDSLLKAN